MSGAGQNRIKMRWKGRRRGQDSFFPVFTIIIELKIFLLTLTRLLRRKLRFSAIKLSDSKHDLDIKPTEKSKLEGLKLVFSKRCA